MLMCPQCQSDHVINHGSAAGKPKKQCQQCGYQFTRTTPRGKLFTGCGVRRSPHRFRRFGWQTIVNECWTRFQWLRIPSWHPKHFHHLVTEVVDDLDGDAS